MTSKRGPGQPRLAAGKRRDDVIRIRLTRSEWRAIRRTASLKALTLSSFIRSCVECHLVEPTNA